VQDGEKGVFVTKIEPRRQAAISGRINVGDRLVKVGGRSVGGSFDKAVEFIRGSSGNEVPFLFERRVSKKVGDVDAERVDDGRRIKARIRGESRGMYQLLGSRKYQEDSMLLKTIGSDDLIVGGVFDGHGGLEASTFAVSQFADLLKERMEDSNNKDEPESIQSMLEWSWSETCDIYKDRCSIDEEDCRPAYNKLWGVLSASTGSNELKAGSTGAVALFDKRTYDGERAKRASRSNTRRGNHSEFSNCTFAVVLRSDALLT